MVQGTLFDRRTCERIDAQFARFDADNPHVYAALVSLARQAKCAGLKRIGAKLLWERLRWDVAIQTRGDGDWKLDNRLVSRYARAIMEREPDLAGFFELRRLHR